MLAYVFWHWPNPEFAAADYEDLLRAFHTALKASAPTGFVRSVVFRVSDEAAWLGGAPAYADWYLVAASSALDSLNIGAVSGMCQQPHEAVARAAAAGAGSLLALRGADAHLADARSATWLTKPTGMPYEEFYALVEALLPGTNEASLWRRQMVLGPTPEFGLLSSQPLRVPEQFQPLSLGLKLIT